MKLWRELGELMTKDCTVIRYNKNLQQTDARLVELLERFRKINLSDRTHVGEYDGSLRAPALQHAAVGAGDCAGRAHAGRVARRALQAGFPERDDKNWLKTTKAYFAPDADEPKFEFEPVDVVADSPEGEEVLNGSGNLDSFRDKLA